MILGGLEPAQDKQEAQPEDFSLDHPDKSGGDWCGDNPGQLREPSGDWSRSLDQPERTGSDWPSKGSPENWGLSYETDNPHQAMESKENSPAVPGTDRNLTEARSSERDMTDTPLTERTSPESQGDERSSVSNIQSTEELEEDPESSEETWRQVRTRKSTNGSDDSEVKRNLLEENADSKSGGRPSRYFHDWFDSENNNSESNPKPDKLDELSKNWEQQKPIKTEGQDKHSKKTEKCKKKQPVRPTRFREVMTLISMAGPSETVSRHKHLKVPTAVKFGNRSNIPHGMKFTAGSKAC